MQAMRTSVMKDWKDAGLWFQKAVAIDPNRETAYRYWGDALWAAGDKMGAKAKFVDAIIAEPFTGGDVVEAGAVGGGDEDAIHHGAGAPAGVHDAGWEAEGGRVAGEGDGRWACVVAGVRAGEGGARSADGGAVGDGRARAGRMGSSRRTATCTRWMRRWRR